MLFMMVSGAVLGKLRKSISKLTMNVLMMFERNRERSTELPESVCPRKVVLLEKLHFE